MPAQVKSALELGGLAGSLDPEEQRRRVGGDNGSVVRSQQIAGILGRKHERPVVLADPAGKADDEAADGRVLEQEPELVDHEHPAAILSLDSRPQSFSEE